MDFCGKAFEVFQQIVFSVAVLVMDVATVWYCAECNAPNFTVKIFPAALKIFVSREYAVDATIEILSEGVKEDWISIPFVRDSADFHPLSVLNK